MFEKFKEIIIIVGPHEIVVLTMFGCTMMLWGIIVNSLISGCP